MKKSLIFILVFILFIGSVCAGFVTQEELDSTKKDLGGVANTIQGDMMNVSSNLKSTLSSIELHIPDFLAPVIKFIFKVEGDVLVNQLIVILSLSLILFFVSFNTIVFVPYLDSISARIIGSIAVVLIVSSTGLLNNIYQFLSSNILVLIITIVIATLILFILSKFSKNMQKNKENAEAQTRGQKLAENLAISNAFANEEIKSVNNINNDFSREFS